MEPNFKVKPIRLLPGEMAILREQVFKRDKYTCQMAHLTPGLKCVAGLTAHHVKYRSQGGDDTLENLVTLCMICHTLIHREIWACDILGLNGAKKRELAIPSLDDMDIAISLIWARKQKLTI